MPKIIECVPNFSEGRDKDVIASIADAIRKVNGVRLLDVDPGTSTHRTVYTFIGGPEEVIEGALAAAKVAAVLIDMSKHKGEHPRMGSMDVCPFIPVSDVTEEECVDVAKRFGKRLAEELDVPVFLYGAAASASYRKTLPQIRAGEYEGLKIKLNDPKWKPDFGPAEFNPRWGGTVTGVRKFLIAYNINVLSTKEQAHRIALNLREQGRCTKNQPGRLKGVQGIGWYLEEKNLAQISVNITDYEITPLHIVFEEAKKDAEALNLAVTGSEIVGLVPLGALLMAAEYYIENENLLILDESQKVHLVINRLGLSTLSPFNPKERIIEYCLETDPGPLIGSPVAEFVKQVRARTPAPGGGSVAALVAALGSALAEMACQLTYGKRQWEHLDPKMRKLLPVLRRASEVLLPLVDADTKAFSDVMASMKLPKSTLEEVDLRKRSMHEATKKAIEVPLAVLRSVSEVLPSLQEAAQVANFSCKSDIQVGAKCLETGAIGAFYNVRINLENFEDENEKMKIQKEAEDLLKEAEMSCENTLRIIGNRRI